MKATEETTTKEKQVKYICYKCGVTVKAPKGFNMVCSKCDYELLEAPTSKAEYEAALTTAFQNIAALTAQIEQLETHLNPNENVIDADFYPGIILDKNVEYVDGTNTPVVNDTLS